MDGVGTMKKYHLIRQIKLQVSSGFNFNSNFSSKFLFQLKISKLSSIFEFPSQVSLTHLVLTSIQQGSSSYSYSLYFRLSVNSFVRRNKTFYTRKRLKMTVKKIIALEYNKKNYYLIFLWFSYSVII